MNMLIRAFIIILLSSLFVSAQTKTFRWSDELCKYSGTYDSSKVSAAQLQNTLELSMPGAASLATYSAVFAPADIDKLDIARLDAEYKQRLAKLKNADIVNTPFWQNLRAGKLKELEQTYRLSRIEILAFKDPLSLKEYKDAPECSRKYAEPLIAGGQGLLDTWRSVNEDSRKNNGDPERVRRTFEEQLASSERMQFAFIEVMGFGFHNCANALIDYVPYDEAPAKEFRKLFKSVKTINCDEP